MSEKGIRSNRKLLEGMIDGMTSDIEQAIQRQYRVYCLSTHPRLDADVVALRRFIQRAMS